MIRDMRLGVPVEGVVFASGVRHRCYCGDDHGDAAGESVRLAGSSPRLVRAPLHFLAAFAFALAWLAFTAYGDARAASCSNHIQSVKWETEAYGPPYGPTPPVQHALFLRVKVCPNGGIPANEEQAAWNGVLARAGGMPNGSYASMAEQFECHAYILGFPFSLHFKKPAYDLEPWREAPGSKVFELNDKCNPPPREPVYGVGEVPPGTSVPSATQQSFEGALLHSKNGGPVALGEPGSYVTAALFGAGCAQEYIGGVDGGIGGAGGIVMIAGRNCGGGGPAYVVAGDFLGYLLRHVSRNPFSAFEEIGYPIDEAMHRAGGYVQEFEEGGFNYPLLAPHLLLRGDSQTEAHDVYGAILEKYEELGRQRGVLGFPRTDQYESGTGAVCQDFMGGTIEWDGTPQPARVVQRCRRTVTEFSAGITPFSTPHGITAGPDGNLWFTEEVGNRIGRITPSGAVTEFSSGITALSRPYTITAGPDGNLWFTEIEGGIREGPYNVGRGAIGRITPSGVVTEFSSGISAGSGPFGITAGPDGNLWFVERDGNRIGRITPSGTVTEFSSGISAGSEPLFITTGPDGNLWFTEAYGNRIGRITPSGVVTEFSSGLSARAVPYGITAGPDGNLWFAEYSGNRIGRITP